jgi:hypothetical protein
MKHLPINSYADYQELCQAYDRIKNKKGNEKLQEARKLAESYYAKGKNEIGARILKIAGDAFTMNQMKGVIV